jgi:hypothetical protein
MASWQRSYEREVKVLGALGVVRGVAIVTVVLGLAIPGYFDVMQPSMQGDAPAAVVRQLCADELQQDYMAVYTLLSSSFIQQYRLNQDQFVQSQQVRDQQVGLVVACTNVGRDYRLSVFNLGAVFQVRATLTGGRTAYTGTGPIELVSENGWKISSEGIDAVLHFAG